MILNRKRFLSKYGLMDLSYLAGGGGGIVPTSNNNNNNDNVLLATQRPLQAQLVGLVHAVHYLKVPIIVCNVITIIFEMLLGGT